MTACLDFGTHLALRKKLLFVPIKKVQIVRMPLLINFEL